MALLELHEWVFFLFFVCFCFKLSLLLFFLVARRSRGTRGQESRFFFFGFFFSPKLEDDRLDVQGNFVVCSKGSGNYNYTGGGSSSVKAEQCEILTCFLLKDNKLDESFLTNHVSIFRGGPQWRPGGGGGQGGSTEV